MTGPRVEPRNYRLTGDECIVRPQYFEEETWLEPEQFAYGGNRKGRKGVAICPDGVRRLVYAGVPDSAWTIPAKVLVGKVVVTGFLMIDPDSGAILFKPNEKARHKGVFDKPVA